MILLHENSNCYVYRKGNLVRKCLKIESKNSINEIRINNIINNNKNSSKSHLLTLDNFFVNEKGLYTLEMECGINDLFTIIQNDVTLDNDILLYITKEMISSIYQLHKLNIVHFDISLENFIVMKNGRIKLCDFGLSSIVNEAQNLTHNVGKKSYMPPEMINKQPIKHPKKSDIYSFGVCVFHLITRVHYDEEISEIVNNFGAREAIKTVFKTRNINYDDTLSFELEYILNTTLNKRPSQRNSSRELYRFLWEMNIDNKSLEVIKKLLV